MRIIVKSRLKNYWELPGNEHMQSYLNDVLLVLIEGYENKNHPMPPSDPVDAINFLMDQMNLTRKDLEVFLGPKSRVSDVLNRKRNLTLPQIVKWHKELHIPYESLIEERYYL